MVTDAKITSVMESVWSQARPRFQEPTLVAPGAWDAHVQAAVERANLGDPALEAEIAQTFREGRVWLRQANVDLSPQGGGAVDLPPLASLPWAALQVPVVFTPQKDDEKKPAAP